MNKPKVGPLHSLLRANRLSCYRLEGQQPLWHDEQGWHADGRTRVCCLLEAVRAVATPETLEELLDNNRTHPIASKNDNK